MRVWAVGKLVAEMCVGEAYYWSFDFVGVFSTERGAVDACKTKDYWVGPVEIDKPFPEEVVDWPGCYYPKDNK